MNGIAMDHVTELTPSEAERIDGGTYVQVAVFLVGCFKAGFLWGYNELGPAIAGD